MRVRAAVVKSGCLLCHVCLSAIFCTRAKALSTPSGFLWNYVSSTVCRLCC